VLDQVLGYLRCPHCGGALTRSGQTVGCPAGHSFDVARQGYLSLLPAGTKGDAGDTADMVRARDAFLRSGHFAGLARSVADIAVGCVGRAGQSAATAGPTTAGTGCVVDVGAGTGYYLAAVLDRLPRHVGLALDISKNALRVAARAHQRIGAVGCDAWRPLPVSDSVADLALNVFAPRDGPELRRILAPAGHLLVVTPGPDHLGELVAALGLLSVDQRKAERLAAKLGPYFDVIDEQERNVTLELDHAAVGALVAMGPSSRHAEPAALAARIRQLREPIRVTVAVRVSLLRPAASGRP
jgi:23S rRNA (guanine745-N1)-methyltransferase